MGKFQDAINQAFGLGRSETTNPDHTGTGWWSREPRSEKTKRQDKATKAKHYDKQAKEAEKNRNPEQRDGKLW